MPVEATVTSAQTVGPVAAGPFDVLHPLPLTAVRLREGGMLGDWQLLNREHTIPHVVERLESSGVLDNFRRLVGESDAPYRGFNFADSDLHKALEAIAWEAGRLGEEQPWEPFVQQAVDLLTRVQTADGYLMSHVQGAGTEPFADLRWGHELYVLGHLVQAAVARLRTTGRTDLLDVARRFADLVVQRFGPDGQPGYCGHPEVETALVELWRTTGDRTYLDTAQRMVDLRGSGLLGEGPFPPAYHQDHLPVRQTTVATGHAVRQVYLATGVADLVAETGDEQLRAALLRVWDSAEDTKTYVTGGQGSRHKDESFGDPYELPADRAYAETCAAIASFQLAWRLLLLTGESRFADAMERTLLNAVAASTAVDGRHFFYANPLQLRTDHDDASEFSPQQRLDWFACACCPPNLARLLASLHAYVATRDDDGLRLHLYADADVTLDRRDGADPVELAVRTDYPWDGRVRIEAVRGALTEPLHLRVPGWADPAQVTVAVDGHAVAAPRQDGWAVVAASPDHPVRRVELVLAMPVVAVHPHPRVDAARGTVALRRGPVVFCVEQVDLPDGVVLEDVALVPGAELTTGAGVPELGVPVTVRAAAVHRPAPSAPWSVTAAPRLAGEHGGAGTALTLVAVPYARWANRAPGAMRVWLPVETAP